MMRIRDWGLTIGITVLWPTTLLAQTTALAQTIAPQGSEADYILGPGDQIQVNVYQETDMTGTHVIAPDGQIRLPLIGPIQAAGQTPDRLGQQLQQRLGKLYRRPIVNISLQQLRPLRIHISGEVRRPGPLQIRNTAYEASGSSRDNNTSLNSPNLNSSLPTLSAAIVAAGGVTRNGDISQVALTRNGVVESIDLWQGLTTTNAAPDRLLRDGDAIFIAKRPANSPIDPRLIAQSSLAPTTVRVRVIGEVRTPGEVSVTPNSTISSAIAVAGGPTDKARMEEVRLVRLGSDDQITEQRLNLQQLQDQQQVLDGDVVVVPKSRNAKFLDTVNQVFPPLGILFNLFRSNGNN
jgi:polysaccharide biosynthesis/export protein